MSSIIPENSTAAKKLDILMHISSDINLPMKTSIISYWTVVCSSCNIQLF